MAKNETSRSPTPKAVKDQITEAFVRRARADAGQIKVDIHNGEVVLRGHVPSSRERDQAEETAWTMPGVDSVVNKLEVAGDESNYFEV